MNGSGGAVAILAMIIAVFILPVVWMLIKQSMTKVGEAAADAIKPPADAPLYLLKATAKARDVFQNHTSIFLSYTASSWQELDEQLHRGVEQQLMMLAFSTSLLNIAVQDVAYDEGAVDQLRMIQGQNGFPKLKLSDEAFVHALRTVWEPLSEETKTLLAAHYRRFFTGRNSGAGRDASLFARLSDFTTRKLSDEFSYRMQPNTDWLDYIRGISIGDADEARQMIR